MLTAIAGECARAGRFIGHVKLTVDAGTGPLRLSITTASDIPAGDTPAGAAPAPSRASMATAVLNARVAADPAELETFVDAALAGADRTHRTRSRPMHSRAFRPSYPRPTHRLPALP